MKANENHPRSGPKSNVSQSVQLGRFLKFAAYRSPPELMKYHFSKVLQPSSSSSSSLEADN